MKKLNFARDEDGALLVFFAICAAAVFLVASLSFDLGQRASTQTELQSFADNVALAAAGELNGFPNAIDRAERAARELIKDNFVFGTEADGGEGDADKTLEGTDDYDIFFYATLPPLDETGLTAATALPKDPTSDGVARFARVVVKDVNVDWDFANLLSIFSNDSLPSEAVNAEAVAGYTSLACDVAPVFFCKPENASSLDIGNTIRLKAGANGSDFWEPGNFTWLNLQDQLPIEAWSKNSPLYNPKGPCAEFAVPNPDKGFNPDLYECLFSAGTGTLCFENGTLKTKPGGSEGVITAVFNSRFDVFSKNSAKNKDDYRFAPAPNVITSLDASTTCGSSFQTTDTTMGMPADDCFTGWSTPGCESYGGEVRYGNGIWTKGRIFYADVNYSLDAGSVGIVNPGEIVTIGGFDYHKDDPMRPTGGPEKPGLYKGFPELDTGATQWSYYQAEVAASLYGTKAGPTAPLVLNGVEISGGGNNEDDYEFTFNTKVANFPNELIKNITDPAGNTLYERKGASAANCAPSVIADPKRRTLVAAVVDCSPTGKNAPGINGLSDDIIADSYVEVFMLTSSGTMRPTTNGSTTPTNANADKEIYVQIISPALNSGEFTVDPGKFRNLVQLYR